MNVIKSFTLLQSVFLLAGAACLAENNSGLIYQNDFVTRINTDAGASTNIWLSMPYTEGKFIYVDWEDDSHATNTAWYDEGILQDGWIPCKYDRLDEEIVNDTGNYFMRFASNQDWDNNTAYIRTSLYNTFTGGIVRLSVDMRPPSSWYYNGNCGVRLADHLALSNIKDVLDTGVIHSHSTGVFGFCGNSFFVQGGNRAGTIGNMTLGGIFDASHWYRFIAVYNLDNESFNVMIYDLGTTHRDLGYNPGTTPVHTFSDVPFVGSRSGNSMGGLSTVLVNAKGIRGGSNKAEAVYVDNLEIGAVENDEFISCYKNNFNVRYARMLYPVPASAGFSYVDAIPEGAVSTNLYNSIPHDVAGSLDNWIVLNGTHVAKVVTNSIGQGRLQIFSVDEKDGWVVTTHPLGVKVRHGIFCAQMDIRPTTDWYWWSNHAYIYFGDDYLYQLSTKGKLLYHKHRAFGCGIWSENYRWNPTLFKAVGGNGTGTVEERTVGENCPNTLFWYRFIIHADLDANTFDLSIYQFGKDQPTFDSQGTLIRTATGVPFKTNIGEEGNINMVDGISSINLDFRGFHGSESNKNESMHITNIRCWVLHKGTVMLLK